MDIIKLIVGIPLGIIVFCFLIYAIGRWFGAGFAKSFLDHKQDNNNGGNNEKQR